MKKSRLFVNRNFIIDRIDRNLFGTFIENGEMVTGLIHAPGHPKARPDGFRQDTIDLLKQLKTPLLRVSGNHNSGYDWKSGIGPKEEREPRLDPAWGWIDDNQMGMDEYFQWAKEIGAEVMPSVNLGTGTPNDARDMIEYANHPGGSKYSNLRIRLGRSEPYGFRFWGLGNELDGHWQVGWQPVDHYPLKAEQAAMMMKVIDPSIKTIAVGSSTSGMPTFIEWEYKTLMQAPELFDYIALHTYYGNHDDTYEDFLSQTIDLDQFIRGAAGVCESVETKLRLDKKFYLSVDEWNVSHHATYNFPYHTYNEKRLPIFPPYSMADVLMFALQLIVMMNHSDRVKIACVSLITSLVWARNKEKDVLKTACFYPFQIMNELSDGYALRQTLETDQYASKYYSAVPYIESASVLQDNGKLVIFAVNRDTKEENELEIHPGDFGPGMKIVSHTEMQDNDPDAVNSLEDPFRVVPRQNPVPEGLTVSLKPMSFNVIVLQPDSLPSGSADFTRVCEMGRPTAYISTKHGSC